MEQELDLDTFGSASHDEILQLVIQVSVLLGAARLLGGLAQRLNQPSVVGEILAGVVLGPSLISGIFPAIGRWIVPQTPTQGYLLETVALIGVMMLLVVTGLETDLGLIRRRLGTALGVAVGGLVLPFATGLWLGYAIPGDLLADPGRRDLFALFLATALSISAIPVLAKVLLDLNLMRRNIGQTLLAAGMIDDITGWTLLGLVTALTGAGAITAGTMLETLGLVVLFILSTVLAGVWLVDRGLTFVQAHFRGQDRILTLVVVLAFAWGAFSHALHLEPVLGAFAIGILFGRSPRIPADTIRKLEASAFGIFAPIFFAVAGLKVDVSAILEPRLLAVTLIVVAVATFGKVVGAYAGARLLSKQDHWSALAYGSGLNARGALEIIVATIGLSLGILSQELFSMIVLMAVVTSLMAPLALRYTVARVEPDEEERGRLSLEAALQESFVGGIRRLLIPVRPQHAVDPTRAMQATIVDRLGSLHDVAVTLFSVVSADRRHEAQRHLLEVSALFGGVKATRVVVSDDPVWAILEEAAGDYDLMVLGAPTESGRPDTLFGATIDELMKLSPCPTLLVKGMAGRSPWQPGKILVPTDGKRAAHRAAELAIAIAGEETEVQGLHVLTSTTLRTRRTLAEDITAEMEKVGSSLGKTMTTDVISTNTVEEGILSRVASSHPDLLVLGTEVRAGTTRLHLGPRVEFIVTNVPCAVLVLNV